MIGAILGTPNRNITHTKNNNTIEAIEFDVNVEMQTPKLTIPKINRSVTPVIARKAGQTFVDAIETSGELSSISKANKTDRINGIKRTIYFPIILLMRILLRGMEFAIISRNVPFSFSPEMELKVKSRAASDTINVTLKRKSAFPKRSDWGLSIPESLTV
jgi:hypothetical protein